jgi:hypothetical protein
MMFANIDQKKTSSGVYEKRLTGRFALPNKDINNLESYRARRAFRTAFERVADIGRANLLVSRFMMCSIINQKKTSSGVYEKRLTGRFALTNRNN